MRSIRTCSSASPSVDTSENGPYQSFDKALDIYYLSIAYLAAMRNWTSDAAFRIAQFLLYYRLVGVVLFELLEERAILLLFPNTFEYFFILYELVRLRFEPSRFSARFWLLAAAGLWIFVKLPQEYWIHIAKLDFTETVGDYPPFAVAVVARAARRGVRARPRGVPATARSRLGMATRAPTRCRRRS